MIIVQNQNQISHHVRPTHCVDLVVVCFDIQLIFVSILLSRSPALEQTDWFSRGAASYALTHHNHSVLSASFESNSRLRLSLMQMNLSLRRRRTMAPQTPRPHPWPLRTRAIVAPHVVRRYAASARASERAVWRTHPCIVSRPGDQRIGAIQNTKP